MNEILALWAERIKPSAGLPTVQWSILWHSQRPQVT